MRNPIGALVNWLRVVRDGGLVYLIVPDKRRTFDRLRVRTTLAHLVLDYERPSAERDFEHFLDYARVRAPRHDRSRPSPKRRGCATPTSASTSTSFFRRTSCGWSKWIDGHVTPVSIVEGPVLSPAVDEFHVLLRKGAQP